jgi:hypothetical protein
MPSGEAPASWRDCSRPHRERFEQLQKPKS